MEKEGPEMRFAGLFDNAHPSLNCIDLQNGMLTIFNVIAYV